MSWIERVQTLLSSSKHKESKSKQAAMSHTGHATATVNGQVIADAESWEVVEGNIYFPPSSLKMEFLTTTDQHSTCPWKGEASYYTIKVGDKSLDNAAWYYPAPKEKAEHIKDHVAFYKNKVEITTN